MQKKGFVFIVIMIVAIFLAAGYFFNQLSQQAAGPPALTVSEEVGDLGKIMPDKEQTYIFTLKNEGGENLIIERVQATCGCTATILSDEEIAPGKTGQLEVTFDPKGYEGQVSKSIYIHSNDPENQRKKIAVKADIEHTPSPKIELSQQQWDLGLLSKGDSKNISLTLSNRGDLGLEIKSIDLPEHIDYGEQKVELPIQLAPEDSIEIDFSYDSSDQETGVEREYIRMVTNDPKRKNVNLRIEGYIKAKENVVLIYPQGSFPIIENEETRGYEAKFLLKNNSEEIVRLFSVQSPVGDPNPGSQEVSLAPGEEQEIILPLARESISGSDLGESLQETIYFNIALPVKIEIESE